MAHEPWATTKCQQPQGEGWILSHSLGHFAWGHRSLLGAPLHPETALRGGEGQPFTSQPTRTKLGQVEGAQKQPTGGATNRGLPITEQ